MNYGEQICEAASIVAKGVIRDMHFDKTVKAVIVKNNDIDVDGNLKSSLTGEYICSYENNTFQAYGSPCGYSRGDVVYVNVPMGDWKNRKTIIGAQSNVNIVFYNDTLKAYDKDGAYLCDINTKFYDDYETRKW